MPPTGQLRDVLGFEVFHIDAVGLDETLDLLLRGWNALLFLWRGLP